MKCDLDHRLAKITNPTLNILKYLSSRIGASRVYPMRLREIRKYETSKQLVYQQFLLSRFFFHLRHFLFKIEWHASIGHPGKEFLRIKAIRADHTAF